jgi:hypothetical protein
MELQAFCHSVHIGLPSGSRNGFKRVAMSGLTVRAQSMARKRTRSPLRRTSSTLDWPVCAAMGARILARDVQALFHVACCERPSVVQLHTLPELEDPGEVVRVPPTSVS